MNHPIEVEFGVGRFGFLIMMNDLRWMTRRIAPILVLFCFLLSAGVAARAQSVLPLDNFEAGVGKWTRNDKIKSEAPDADVLLVDVLATRPTAGGALKSEGAGLFTFKAAKDSWASASLKIDGRSWAKIGAKRLNFWLNADGQTPGIDLLLRGQARQSDGSTRDIVYELPLDPATRRTRAIGLNVKSWREVVIPLRDFHDRAGHAATSNLSGLYLLQFVQRGTWNSRFFTVDDMRVVGTGVPIASPIAAPPTQPDAGQPDSTTPDASANADAIPVGIDFLRSQGRIRSAANVSLGARWSDADGVVAYPLETSEEFRAALKTLAPRFVRLDGGSLVELIDSARPAFDFKRLVSSSRAVRALGLEPMVALPAPAAWGLDARGYALFVGMAARALNVNNSHPVRYFELPTGTTTSASSALLLFNRGYSTLKAQSRLYRVGGVGSLSQSTLKTLLSGAKGLDFLSVPFYGAKFSTATTPALFQAARNPVALREAGALLDRSKFKNAPLYVTSANLNSSRVEGGVMPDDARLAQPIAAAWWATLLGNGSRIGDQIFHNDAVNPEWGLLNERNYAFYSYYSMYLWNTFFPSGSTRVQTKIDLAKDPSNALFATAANTSTAHNVLLVNTSERAITARLTIRGFLVLRSARLRLLQAPLDPKTGVSFRDLPKSPFQIIELPPYAVAVLQFIEPPKKR